MIELNDAERGYLVEVLDAAHNALMHQLHHADSLDFKRRLRNQVALNEALRERLDALEEVAV
jgi:hypothetical protein